MYWEYSTVFARAEAEQADLEQLLNSLGKERWMLVAVVFNGITQRREYYLRRELFERIG